MTTQRRYKITDDRFGRHALMLREQAGLTQLEVADALGVSRRTIQHWEAGTAFPANDNLKGLIALFLRHGGFPEGQEQDGALALWSQADESAARRPALFDERWFAALLAQHRAERSVEPPQQERPDASPQPLRIDWGEAPEVGALFGRERELATLAEWALDQRCAVMVLLGIGGMGKTSLSVQLARATAAQFSCVIWRSLRDAPPLADLLADYFRALAAQPPAASTQSVDRCITHLIGLLRERRCLLILDNVETLLEGGSLEGRYVPGYQDYRLFFQRMAETTHQSCLLLTSREMLSELEPLEGANAPVRTLKLHGLARVASQALLEDKELFGLPDAWELFVQQNAGNPLALKIAAAAVRNLFGGDLDAYLRDAPVTLHTLNQLLDDQFRRLTPLEQNLLVWLAIERAPVTVETLSSDLFGSPSKRDVLTALVSLHRRSLIERSDRTAIFSLLPVVLEYVSTWLVTQVADELAGGELGLATTYALQKVLSADHIRESQVRMLVQPVLATLLRRFADQEALTAHIQQLLQQLRERPLSAQGYAGGNLVNLLAALQGHLRRCDLSHVLLRQAYFEGIEAQDANLAGADVGGARFTEPLDSISSTAVSPDGQYLAAGSFSGQIRVWRIPDWRPMWFAKGHTRITWAVAFSPDSSLLASGGSGGRVNVWEVASGRKLQVLNGHQQWVRSVAFQPGGEVLVSAGDDGTIRVWDIKQSTCLHVLTPQSGIVWSVAFSPDGNLLVSGGRDGVVRLWDARSWECIGSLRRHTAGIFRVAFHPDGILVASGGEDGQINLWDVAARSWVSTLPRQATGPAAVAFNPEGNLLAGGSSEGAIELWEHETEGAWQHRGRLQSHSWLVNSVAFAPGGLLASIAIGERMRLWDAAGGKRLRTIEGHSQLMSAVAFSPDSTLLAQGDNNGIVRVWDVHSGHCLSAAQAHSGPVWAIAWSPDGERFATAGDGGAVNLWPARGGSSLRSFGEHPGVIWALAFSPDGTLLASGGAIGQIMLWDTRQEEQAQPLRMIATSWIWTLAFDPSGSVLASGHARGEVRLWDVVSGQSVRTLQHGTKPVDALQFTDSGKTLLSSDHELLKWTDTEDGGSLRTEPHHDRGKWVRSIALGHTGTCFATAGDDKVIHVWGVGQDGQLALRIAFAGHAGQIWSVSLSANDRLVASSDDAGTVLVWDAKLGTILCRLSPDRPYERMQIQGLLGASDAQRASLRVLGATEDELEAEMG